MDFATAKAVIDGIQGPFRIQLAGGEPLLNFDLVKRIYAYAKQQRKKVLLALQTNGTLLTPGIAKELKEMNISVGVSLDGPPEVNEQLRGKTGEVIRGIKYLAEYGINVNLTCVISVHNIGYLPLLVDYAFYLGNVKGIGLDLLRKTGNALENAVPEASPDEISHYLTEAYQRTKYFYQKTGRHIVIREIASARKRLERGIAAHGYCLAAVGKAAVVLPNGQVYPCGSLAGRPAYLMGQITEPLKCRGIPLPNNYFPLCETCSYGKICSRGCPARAIINNEDTCFSLQDCAVRKTAFQIVEKEKRFTK